MTRSRTTRRLAALAALLAIALQALWPLLSHARPRDASLLVPVCTIDGITHYLEIQSGKTPLDERSSKHGDHCKLCVFGEGNNLAVFTGDLSSFLLAGVAGEDPESPRASFRPATPSSAHPRAPPVVS